MVKFSIIIPMYNSEKYVCRCIDSIKYQTYDNFEVLIINDGSTDNSEEVCKSAIADDSRFILINKDNGGVSSARNIGLNNSSGDYIIFVDIDDFLQKDALMKFSQKIDVESPDIVFCRYFRYYSEEKCVENTSNIAEFIEKKDLTVFFSQLGTNYRAVWAKAFKKDLFKNIEFNSKIKIAEDFLVLIQTIQKASKLIFLDEALYYYVDSETSVMKNKNEKYFNNYINGLLACKQYFLENNMDKDLVSLCEYEIYMISASQYIYIKDKSNLLKYEKFNNKHNYVIYKRLGTGFKFKIKLILFRHKLFFCLNLIIQLKK